MIKGIIFDLDGVLVDAVDWHFKALNKALSLFGYSLEEKEHQEKFDGLPTAKKLEMLSESKGLPRNLHSFIVDQKQVYTLETIKKNCAPSKEITELLSSLKERGYSLAVASNSVKQTIHLVLDQMRITPYFDTILSRQDVSRGKPHPDIFYRALELMNLGSNETLIIEDSKPGIIAANQVTPHVFVVKSPKEVNLNNINPVLNKLDQSPSSENISFRRNNPLIQIVVPMAGLGTRFQAAGYEAPKPFINVLGKPMIQWVVENMAPSQWLHNFTFLCHNDHMKETSYIRSLKSMAPKSQIVPVLKTTEGAACTVLLGVDKLNPSQPLVLANSDQWIDAPIDDFIEDAINSGCDGSIMTFKATEDKWSYARLNKMGRVVEVAEKVPISEHATVGIYYFKHAQDFIDGAFSMIKKDIRTKGEFYVCPVYNELISTNKRIKIFEIEKEKMHGLGTPEDLETFLNWVKNQPVTVPPFPIDPQEKNM
ncbi:MAG: HAD family hydrolase [Proteobacteria bacterium]|nr:HAD family hydrolase [Pseudomonadota bacterium]